MPLCLTFFDLKKVFVSVETEAVKKAFDNQHPYSVHKAESAKGDVHAQRIGPGCPIHAQRNEYIGMQQLRLSGLGIELDERPDSQAGQEETSGLGSV
ncbi:hypothetical protein RB195_010227 [Necator americanus]|uniref:Reverse transcriptase domain-containing protein n=1 Tax=Necator americanus TaxID=51031 RepID=A0ABR1CX00_NECAM